MRQVVLDTETTGLEPEQGHRIIEIGCAELVDRRLTDRRFHCYLNPEREIEDGAWEVHGISREQLRDKPRFADIAEELLDFLRGAELIIHNAGFDVAFLDAELARLPRRLGPLARYCKVTDTLALARHAHPGQRNSLDALCARYRVDNSLRQRHGALFDAEILADVYLAMTGGQASLELAAPARPGAGTGAWALPEDRPRLRVIRASDVEIAAHRARLQAIDEASGGNCAWTAHFGF